VPDEARACADLLTAAGWRVESLDAQETCCGAPLHEAGFAEDAARKGQHLRQQIAAHGAEELSVLGAECLEALAERHPSAGGATDLPPRHPLVLVLEAVRAGQLALTPRPDRPPPHSIGYLDPCHLTKKSHGAAARGDLAAAARALLALIGCEVAGDVRAARFAVCCGAAGGMPDMQPEAAGRMGAAKLDSLAGRGVAAVVTASPLCLGHLRRTRREDQPAVFGLFEFLHAHFTPQAMNGEDGR
jgi:Fe-S oxidoreductase